MFTLKEAIDKMLHGEKVRPVEEKEIICYFDHDEDKFLVKNSRGNWCDILKGYFLYDEWEYVEPPKVRKWKWAYRNFTGNVEITNKHYTEKEAGTCIPDLVGKVDSTEIYE